MKSIPVAVIGMAVRLPDANMPETFWDNLCAGRTSIRRLANSRSTGPNHVPYSSFPDNIESFDASFFGVTPHEAEIMDPQHRMLLECSWEAFESAGYEPTSHPGKVGVFAGCALNSYLLCNLMTRPEYLQDDRLFPLILGSNPDFLATRVSYKLNLRGPSCTVQSACSTSLLAVHSACKSLQAGECDMALAGGVALNLKLRDGYSYVEGGIFSADGTCRAFDADATGTVFGNGAGVVLLKPLANAIEDGDHIWAIIRGSAVNNDGAEKVGFTAPRAEGQSEVIMEALRSADVLPSTVSYIETHGTGTPLGDPIEFAALSRAYDPPDQPAPARCAIGSVKTNVGHLDAAAGITGFIKTVLALKHGKIPPTLNFRKANPQISFSSTRFYVNTELREWLTGEYPRRAGVSAFGVGGTNVHLILEEAPAELSSAEPAGPHLITLSARSEPALQESVARLRAWLRHSPDARLEDVSYTLRVGRKSHDYRSFCVASSINELAEGLDKISPITNVSRHRDGVEQRVTFVLPGEGVLSGADFNELYEKENIFHDSVTECVSILGEHKGNEAFSFLSRPENLLSQVQRRGFSEVSVFITNLALAKLWMARGLSPRALLGYSLGECVAAHLSGVFTLKDALGLMTVRAIAVESTPPGAMLAVYLDESTSAAFCRQYESISIAAIQSPGQCILSGDISQIEQIWQQCEAEGIQSRRLDSAYCLQSPMMGSAISLIERELEHVQLSSPRIPFLSNITGTWITPSQALSKEYWAEHICKPLRFHDCVSSAAEQTSVFLEVGSADSLSRLIRRHPATVRLEIETVPSLDPTLPAYRSLLVAAGKMWTHGISLGPYDSGAIERRSRVNLPTYPFERQRYWVDARSVSESVGGSQDPPRPIQTIQNSPATPRPTLPSPFVEPSGATEIRLTALWQETLGVAPIGAMDNFFDLGGDSLIGIELIERLRKEFTTAISPVDLYEKVTIRMLAELLDQLETGNIVQTDAPPPANGRSVRRAVQMAARRTRSQMQASPTSKTSN